MSCHDCRFAHRRLIAHPFFEIIDTSCAQHELGRSGYAPRPYSAHAYKVDQRAEYGLYGAAAQFLQPFGIIGL